MLLNYRLIAALIVAGLLAACASTVMSVSGPGATRSTELGEVFTDAKGMTLYSYDLDKPGKPTCTGFCAAIWPPVEASKNAKPTGKFTIVNRDNGAKQWAYDGKPLYGYIFDSQPGDTTGEGVDGIWHVARP